MLVAQPCCALESQSIGSERGSYKVEGLHERFMSGPRCWCRAVCLAAGDRISQPALLPLYFRFRISAFVFLTSAALRSN